MNKDKIRALVNGQMVIIDRPVKKKVEIKKEPVLIEKKPEVKKVVKNDKPKAKRSSRK